MSRLAMPVYESVGVVSTASRSVNTPAKKKDTTYTDRLLKYVPTESVTFFLAFNMTVISGYKVPVDGSPLRFAADANVPVFWIVSIGLLLVGLVGTPLYLYKRRDTLPVVNGVEPPWRANVLLGTIAFVIWAYSIGATVFVALGWFNSILGGFLVASSTFLFPLVPETWLAKKPKRAGS